MSESLTPNLAYTDHRGYRYPNQFFDLSQQFMPPTIKELFRWCTFYFYNSPLIGAAIKKVSRYPITDIIVSDKNKTQQDIWDKIFNKILKIKTFNMEVNLDYHVYGNSFVSIHFPFTRFLCCNQCGNRGPINNWDWSYTSSSFAFRAKCTKCNHHGDVTVKDIPDKNLKKIKLIRWNPENIHIKYNEYTGRYIYMYSVPSKLKNAIFRGDKDIMEDIPMIILEALKARRLIRFSENSIFHLKNPTLAEQDQGWGKPAIIHVLKDMYYFYTLRRAQEAIAMEHILPLDIIYPLPNAQQDPYVHSDLGSWKSKIEDIVKKHRRDPNFKGVVPIPVGTSRVGGDGKAMMLNPEMNYLTQTVVSGMGIPSEMVMGGLSWTGSSITLRMLENDFIQNRAQLEDMNYWIKDRVRIWKGLPDVDSLTFADFRMADDIQRNQQLIGLNAQRKVSDQTMLTELGFDYEEEVQKIIEEAFVQNYINDLISKGASKSQGEAQIIQFNYQQKIQELAEKAQREAQKKIQTQQNAMPVSDDNTSVTPEQEMMMQQGQEALPAPMQPPGQVVDDPQAVGQQMLGGRLARWSSQLNQMEPNQARQAIAEIRTKMPELGGQLEQIYNKQQAQMVGASDPAENALDQALEPLPERAAPRASGLV